MELPPVMLVHGWGGSFRTTWGSTPLLPLLDDIGRVVIGVDLLGHGDAPKPHDPLAYADLTERITEALPNTPIDAVGFSLGAMTLLRTAIAHPQAFRRIVLGGIGESAFRSDPVWTARIVAALRGEGPSDDVIANQFAQYADSPGNDKHALAAVMARDHQPLVAEQLGQLTCPVLVVIGDKDFAGPGEPLADALPHGRLVTLRNVDHFATPEAFGFIDAVLDFLSLEQP
jgi:pimeloyl-ACP methyl ester carboxylesterase